MQEEFEILRARTLDLARLSAALMTDSLARIQTSHALVTQSRKLLNSPDPVRLYLSGSLGTHDGTVKNKGSMTNRDIVVIGGSAGSLKPLTRLMSALPKELHAAIFIVQHSSPNFWTTDGLADLLGRTTHHPVVEAASRMIKPGNIYVCPAGYHLLLDNGMMRIDQSPEEHYTRPSIDVLFRSAALAYGRRTVGILLSGTLTDGTAGLWQIKERGGLTMVQNPDSSEFPQMPLSAIQNVRVDHVLPIEEIAEKLNHVLNQKLFSELPKTAPSILIVEDETLVSRNLKERLIELSYQVCGTVTSGEQAIDTAREQSPDLILMDIRLAGKMDGIEAARQIWHQFQIPVVFVTAHADLQTLDEVKTTDSYGYIVKPFQTSAIQAAVELALDRHRKELQRSF